jgi:hypothetical protein
MPTWYHVTTPYAPLHVLPGDVIRYDAGGDDPIEIYRPLGTDSVRELWRGVLMGAITPASDADQDGHDGPAARVAPTPPDAGAPRPPLRMVK